MIPYFKTFPHSKFKQQLRAGDVITAKQGGPFVAGNAATSPSCVTPPSKTLRLDSSSSLKAQPTKDYLSTQLDPEELEMLNEVFQDAQSQHDMSPPRLSPVADNGKAPDVDSPPDGGQAVATPQGRAAIPAPKGSLVSKGHLKPKSAGKPPSKFDKYYHQKLWLRYL